MAYGGGIDERKIEEIVAQVLERLGGGRRDRRADTAADGGAASRRVREEGANIPRGTNGVYADADQAREGRAQGLRGRTSGRRSRPARR